jgi:hypothetical protein
MQIPVFQPGNYRYIKAVFQYSSGVAAQPGFEVERARFARPLPLADAYAAVEAYLNALGRPITAFAACELRTPEPFTEQGFIEFNKVYVKTLERWGIYKEGDEPVNPVARTNVCPMYGQTTEPVMYAFSYTVPYQGHGTPRGSFIIAGGAEGKTCAGESSPEALREKVSVVVAEMERRLEVLGFSWNDAVTTQAYTVQNIGHLAGEILAARGATNGGLVWYYARPPVMGRDFEMDVRGAARELVI